MERHHIPQSHSSSSSTADSRHRRDPQYQPPPFPPPNNPQIHSRSNSGQDPRRQVYPPPDYPPPHTVSPTTQPRSSNQYHSTTVSPDVTVTAPRSSPPQRGRQDGQQLAHPQQQRPPPNRSTASVSPGYSGFDSVSALPQSPLSPYPSPQSQGSPISPVNPYSAQSSTHPYVTTPNIPNQANTTQPPPTGYPRVAPLESNVTSSGHPLPDDRRYARPNAPPVLSAFLVTCVAKVYSRSRQAHRGALLSL